MLRFKIKQLLAEREFAEGRRITLSELSERTGTNRATISRMINQRGVVVRTDVLDGLCAYFNCQIADLVEYVPMSTVKKATPDD